MWIICKADDSHEMPKLIFSEKSIEEIRMSSTAVVTGVLRANTSAEKASICSEYNHTTRPAKHSS